MRESLRIVVLGLSLSSSWGNGHATTFRALLRGLRGLGHDVLFLERDVPWYASNRDLPAPDFCRLAFYDDLEALRGHHAAAIASADAVIVGSYVPDGIDVLDLVLRIARGTRVFYDIDTPVTLASLDRGDCAYIAPLQIPLLDLYLSFSGGRMLDRLARDYRARHPVAFYCAVDETRYRPGAGATRRWDLGYLGTYSEDRQPALLRLLIEPARRLPQQRFVVAGPQYPSDIDWPGNVERIEHLPPSEHPGFYAAQRYTLNVTRADMIAAGHSPSVRLFEAAACGTPIISDDWDGLADLLPVGEAVLVAHSSGDVVWALQEMPEEQRSKFAAAARDIVLASHTGTARAAMLNDALDRVAAQSPRSLNPG
ncbi:CgeB family protein [Lichenicoccus sp.]|uniref:CgeB family protein n=1 Tax=Lichenicoccus sp. TaxID=2781899 RepID=UPI003D11A0C9